MDGITNEELTNEEFKKPLTETIDENEFTLEQLKWLNSNSNTNHKALEYNNEEVTNIREKFKKNEPFINEISEYTFIRQISDILYKVPTSRSITKKNINLQSKVQYNVPDSAWMGAMDKGAMDKDATDIY